MSGAPRILFVGSDLRGVGGIQRYSSWMIDALDRVGPCEVLDLELEPTGATPKAKARAAARVLATWRRSRPQVMVLGHLSFAPLAWPQRLCGQPAVAVAYGIEVWGPTSPVTRGTWRALSQVWPISSFTAGELRRIDGGVRVGPVLGGGLDDVFFAGRRAERDGSCLRIIVVARLDDLIYKGIDTCIEAVERATASIDVELRVIGEGPARRQLDALLHRRGLTSIVRCLGPLDDEALRREYAEAGVAVSVSRFRRGAHPQGEGLGIVALEAGAAGVPAIVSSVGGTVDTVIDGTTGLLVPPGDADALTRALVELGRDPARRARMGRAARAFVGEVHSRDAFRARVREAVYGVVG